MQKLRQRYIGEYMRLLHIFNNNGKQRETTEALEYHNSSFLFPRVSFVSRELVLFPASYFWFPRVIFGFRELVLVSAS